MEANSEGLGKGCSFYFSLPHQSPAQPGPSSSNTNSASETPQIKVIPPTVSAVSTELAVESGASALTNLTVLIADRKPQRCGATAQLLSYMGVMTEVVESLSALPEAYSPHSEVVLTHLEDHALPLPDLVAAATQAPTEGQGPPRKLIVVTRMKNTLSGNPSEGYACVSKPLTAAKLQRALTQLTKKGSPERLVCFYGVSLHQKLCVHLCSAKGLAPLCKENLSLPSLQKPTQPRRWRAIRARPDGITVTSNLYGTRTP